MKKRQMQAFYDRFLIIIFTVSFKMYTAYNAHGYKSRFTKVENILN